MSEPRASAAGKLAEWMSTREGKHSRRETHLEDDVPEQEPEPALPVAVDEIVRAAVSVVTREAGRRGIAVVVEPPSGGAHHRRAGGREGRARQHPRQRGEVFPAGRPRAGGGEDGPGEAVIAVSDSGPGVSAEDVPRLFQRFYRGKASRATDAPGVGLGLAISRALIERQGGRLSVEVSAARKARPSRSTCRARPSEREEIIQVPFRQPSGRAR